MGAAPEPEWPAAIARLEEHVCVRVEVLRELAVAAGVWPDWQAGFDATLGLARSRGWVGEEEHPVRAHAERRTELPGAG